MCDAAFSASACCDRSHNEHFASLLGHTFQHRPGPPTCSYKAAWDSFVDSWLVVKVAQPDYAYRWRLQVRRCGGMHQNQAW